jgi:hypothetical protein
MVLQAERNKKWGRNVRIECNTNEALIKVNHAEGSKTRQYYYI